MKCLKAVMDALKIYQLQTSTKQQRTDLIDDLINDLRRRMRWIYRDTNFVLDLDKDMLFHE